ncbi:hypothetical protein DL546_007586 [Coniochaeta pulveracea]|uniref:Uncharacterized protein n=1 Tax=Coniochaeta pulveracea TaxID=177199 RepID=A0A420YFZ4_9PEZI|nr:hypothetical protein DL546_007586 [Coniochaeta pulveracea]
MDSDTDVSMDTQPSSISFLDLDIPRPLQIIKRSEGPGHLVHYYSRKTPSRADSVDFNAKIPESPEAKWPLSIPKKRFTTRDIRDEASPQKAPDDSGYIADISTPGQIDSDAEDTTPKPQRSTSDMSPARGPEYYPPHSLTTKASMLCLPRGKPSSRPRRVDSNLCPPGRGLRPDIGQRYNSGSTTADKCFGQTSTPPTSRISSSNFDISDSASTVSSDIFKYGCLYDVKAKIIATANSSVLEVLEDKSASSTLYPGSKRLMLAHVQLTPNKPPLCHTRQNSDDLIDALELTLGTTTTEYLSLQLTYRHSAFPERTTNTDRTQTSLTTTCTAMIKRHNPSSPWSPCLSQSRTPKQPNAIFEIISSHWGPDAAADLSRKILFAPNPARLLKPTKPVHIARTVAPPKIPRRKGSLRRGFRLPAVTVPTQENEEETERQNDRARKIWSQIRRMSSVGGDENDGDERTVSTGSVRRSIIDISDENAGQTERHPKFPRDRSQANRDSIVGEMLRDMPTTTLDMKENRPVASSGTGVKGYGMEMGMRMRGGALSNTLNGRWGWSGWWQ